MHVGMFVRVHVRMARTHGAGIWEEIATAVAFANTHDVFHCDINPSNILVPATARGDTSVTRDTAVTGHTSDPSAAAPGSLLIDWACSRQQASLHSKVRVSAVSLVTEA